MLDTSTPGSPETQNELGRIFADPAPTPTRSPGTSGRARLRERGADLKVTLPEYPEFWAITKHADVMEIERNPEVFTNAPVPALATRTEFETGGGAGSREDARPDGRRRAQGPPDHRQRVVQAAQRPTMKDRVDELAKQYVDRMAAMGGECDFANEIAMHFPLQVILSILGLPEYDYQKMLKLTQELFGAEDPDIGRAARTRRSLPSCSTSSATSPSSPPIAGHTRPTTSPPSSPTPKSTARRCPTWTSSAST